MLALTLMAVSTAAASGFLLWCLWNFVRESKRPRTRQTQVIALRVRATVVSIHQARRRDRGGHLIPAERLGPAQPALLRRAEMPAAEEGIEECGT
jgi:hypothetical protein